MNNTIFLSCFVFLIFLILLPAHPLPMFGDPDTWWHLAAGDAIRATGAIPDHDSWSFVSGGAHWLNMSWGWDVALSYIYQHAGWHGVIIGNSMLIAATLTLIFAASFARSQHSLAAFLVTALVAATMLNVTVRPHQVSYLLIAGLNFLLLQIAHRRCSPRWLMLVPPLMVLWVNCHGEFPAAFFFLGIYGIEALVEKNWKLAGWLMATGTASLAACLINPYGIGIIEAVMRTLGGVNTPFIMEWQAMNFSSYFRAAQIYLGFFLVLVMMRPSPALRSEKWVAYSWLLLALVSVRHLNAFAIVSAPMLAVALRDDMLKRTPAAPKPITYNPMAAGVALVATIALSVVMFTPPARAFYHTESFSPPPDLSEEISFLEQHYPHARLFNSYELGGALIFQAQGKIPVFVDSRAETAYPKDVMRDYVAFVSAEKNWSQMLDRYHIDGAIILSTDPSAMDRFIDRRGWRLVYSGKTASIFMRDIP